MAHHIATPKPVLVVREGITFANSRNVAECFNKQHAHVLRDIDKIMGGVSDFGETPWFVEVAVTSSQNGQTYREYEITREGFDILVMGWTGEKAMQFKVLYIREFHAMAEALRQASVQLPDFTNPAEAARAWADAHDQKRLAELKAELAEDRAEEAEEDLASAQAVLGRFEHRLATIAATIPGINRNALKADLHRLGYLRVSGKRYRPYAKFAHLFYEKFDNISGRLDVFATGEGKFRLTKLRDEGLLTLKAIA